MKPVKSDEEIAAIREREAGRWNKQVVMDHVLHELECGDWTSSAKRILWEDRIKYSDCHISWKMYHDWVREAERKYWMKLPAEQLQAQLLQELQDVVEVSMKTVG